MMRLCYFSCFWLILALCLTSCRPEGEVVREDKSNFTVADQAKIGQAFTSHILDNPAEYDLLKSTNYPDANNYLNNLLDLVVTTSTVENRSNFNWKIYIIRDEENKTTFTLPGGKLFVTTGFLKFLTSEAQVLALMSHEIYYSDQGILMDLLMDNYSGLKLGDLLFDNPVEEIGEMIQTLQELPLPSDQTERADMYAIEIMCPFTYSPQGIRTILENVTDVDYPLEWTTIRPGYENRMDNIQNSTIDCGEESTVGEARYMDFLLNYLD